METMYTAANMQLIACNICIVSLQMIVCVSQMLWYLLQCTYQRLLVGLVNGDVNAECVDGYPSHGYRPVVFTGKYCRSRPLPLNLPNYQPPLVAWHRVALAEACSLHFCCIVCPLHSYKYQLGLEDLCQIILPVLVSCFSCLAQRWCLTGFNSLHIAILRPTCIQAPACCYTTWR